MWLIPLLYAYAACEVLHFFPQLLLEMFGRGVYFATDSSKNKKMLRKFTQGSKHLQVCDIIKIVYAALSFECMRPEVALKLLRPHTLKVLVYEILNYTSSSNDELRHSRLGFGHYRDSIYCKTWTRHAISFTETRDSEFFHLLQHATVNFFTFCRQ